MPSALLAITATLLLTTTAQAVTLWLPSPADLDLDNDGTPEITLTTSNTSIPGTPFTRSQTHVVVTAHSSLQFLTNPGTTDATRQEIGSLVGATSTQGIWADNPPDSESASILHFTVLTDPDTGFSSLSFNFDYPYDLAFRFDAPDGTHYGWLRLRPPGDILVGRPVITTLHYNDTPGAPVTVGTTIPEPSTLLLLTIALSLFLSRCRRPR